MYLLVVGACLWEVSFLTETILSSVVPALLMFHVCASMMTTHSLRLRNLRKPRMSCLQTT